MESTILYFDPTAFGTKGSLTPTGSFLPINDYVTASVAKFVCGVILSATSIGLNYCRANRSTHGEYFRAKMLGKMTQPL